MTRLGSILLWSVLAAAFIGPGTVTTAASAGAGHGYALLWALTFSVIACLVLQEAAARLTAVSGLNLGQALRRRYRAGASGAAVVVLVLGAIVVGAAAYEAGNILGAVAGTALLGIGDGRLWTVVLGTGAGLLLWSNAPQGVARLLSVLVALMGVAFLCTAALLRPPLGALALGALVPRLPAGSALLALGLVGTTVVPYNLFLGSGIARGQRLGELRLGIVVAVVLGGVISMGVLVVGVAVDGPFDFAALAAVLVERMGPWGARAVALGLLAAGLSSAITAPLAAAMTAASLLGDEGEAAWSPRGARYRAVWLGVLAVGVGFGVAGAQPIPVIVLAQALNGVLLPFVAAFLFLAVNDLELMGREGLNGGGANLLTASVLAVACLLGLSGVLRAGARAFGLPPPSAALLVVAGLVVGLAVAGLLAGALRRSRAGGATLAEGLVEGDADAGREVERPDVR